MREVGSRKLHNGGQILRVPEFANVDVFLAFQFLLSVQHASLSMMRHAINVYVVCCMFYDFLS